MRTIPRSLARLGLSAALLAGPIYWLLLPALPLLEGIPTSTLVTDRDLTPLRISLSSDGFFRLPADPSETSPEFLRCVFAYEDRHFRWHPGVNPLAIVRAGIAGARDGGRFSSGASTLTMQVARLRYGLETRSIGGKLRQIHLALALERHYSKNEILRAYLTLAPYGGNIQGIEAASLLIYGKRSSELTLPEAISLAVIPQSPATRDLRTLDGNSRAAAPYQAARLRLIARLGLEPEARQDAENFLAEPSAKSPFQAPHLAAELLGRHQDSALIRTTIDLRLQRLVERELKAYCRQRSNFGIRNAAAVLLDNDTLETLAYAGSADFHDPGIEGQVDGIAAARSPGSTLKPFIYGLAIDAGLIHPLSLVEDAPNRHGAYEPENFDRDFLGPISATVALNRSRNVPAVDLLERIGPRSLYALLEDAGIHFAQPVSHYGLSLALGGAEVAPIDLATLYAAIANEGFHRPARTLLGDGQKHGTRLLSRSAAFLVADMLAKTPIPTGFTPLADADIAWKTGTSHGFRDAWCAGFFGRFTLVVWVGNFDGTPNPAFTGLKTAAPLFFQIVNSIDRAGVSGIRKRLVPPDDPGLLQIGLCSLTGALPGPACPRTETGWFLGGVSPINHCGVHRNICVDQNTGYRVSDNRATEPGIVVRPVEVWSDRMLTLFASAGLPRPPLPRFDPREAAEKTSRRGAAPKVRSPSGERMVISTPGNQAIPLVASAEPGTRSLFWFNGPRYIGSSAPDQPLAWNPPLGEQEIHVVDEAGRSTTAHIRVVH